MLINEEKKSVIITYPKTGSTSLIDFFVKMGWRYNNKQHDNYIPPEYEGYTVYICKREPKERALSLYKHYCLGEKDIPLKEFVYDILLKKENAFYSFTVKDWNYMLYTKNMRCTYKEISLENIKDDLRKYFSFTDEDLSHLRHLNSTQEKYDIFQDTEEFSEAIKKWSSTLFTKFLN